MLLLVATIPLWLGVALRWTPEKWGVRYARYERIGYGRFALHDVDYRRGTVHVTATRVESDSPLVWLVHRWRSQPRETVAGRWTVTVDPSPATANSAGQPKRESGWVPLRATLRRVADLLDRWLPQARVGEGTVQWPGGGLQLAGATWTKRTLTVQHLALRGVVADGTAEFPAAKDEVNIALHTTDGAGSVALRNPTNAVDGELTWWDQHATLAGKFGERGWLPAEARLDAGTLNIPGARLKLGDHYATVRGRARVDWDHENFRADITAKGEPVQGKPAPPLEAKLLGHGDLQAFTAEALDVALPGITAHLSAPVTVDRKGNFRESGAAFVVQADLAKQPWFSAAGVVEGEARLGGGVAQSPAVEFKLRARDLSAQGVEIASAETNGRFAWPQVDLAAFTLVGRAGEKLTGRGGWDFRAKAAREVGVEGELRRATLARWLPAQPQFESVALKAQVNGPWPTAQHSGELHAMGVEFSGVKPLAVAASWRGVGMKVEKLDVSASAGTTRLTLAGALDTEALQIAGLEVEQGGESRLKLVQPAVLRWRPVLTLESLRLKGAEAALDADLTWSETGRLAVALHDVPSAWFTDLVTLPGPAWRATWVGLTGRWDRGPMNFSAVVGVAIELGEGRRAIVNLSGRGSADGVRLEALRAAEGDESIVNATGTLPIVFTPHGTKFVTIDERAPLRIDADTAPNASFWQQLSALSGLELKEPHVAVHLKGTWQKPEGDVRLSVAHIAADPKRFKRALPAIENLELALSADAAAVKLDTLACRVAGQELRGGGRLPIPDGDWTKAWKQPLLLAQRDAEVTFEIPDADVAVLAKFLPAYLAPKGRLHLDLNYRRGDFGGALRLSGAATRPLGPLGVLQDIEADIRLTKQAMELRSVTARSGGQDVRLSGRVELPEVETFLAQRGKEAPPRDTQPRFDLALKGENLPFVRSTGLLLRGDLDLKLTTPERGRAPALLSGTVRLRDSLFLQDVRSLLPGGTKSKARRPPYFAVELAPFDAWRLDLNVEGHRFMRLRTPVFGGVASARFNLRGTLGDPMALGEVTLDEGTIRMPFASFEVTDGRVALTREQPYEPQLFVVATSRRLDYDLRLEITGGASAPQLAFSSTPPLDHGQLLLMVMAGEPPKDEIAVSTQGRAERIGAFLGQSLLTNFSDGDTANRLTLTSGEKVTRSTEKRETFDAEYKVSDRLSLNAGIDEFDEYYGGVKWRLYTKGGTRDAEKTAEHKAQQGKPEEQRER